jgi:hypothetical protein
MLRLKKFSVRSTQCTGGMPDISTLSAIRRVHTMNRPLYGSSAAGRLVQPAEMFEQMVALGAFG